MSDPKEIVSYWVDEVGPGQWYSSSKALDGDIRKRFEADWDRAMAGEYDHWICSSESALALLILLDQFPRNMFRNTSKAFASDAKALAKCKKALSLGHDQKITGSKRQFFYMPLMHSENLTDQDKCVRLMKLNMEGDDNLIHAKAHREIIRKFGRFPYRNDALERRSSPHETDFIDNQGYQKILQDLSASA